MGAAALAGVAFLCGMRVAGGAEEPRHAALLTGQDWRAYGFGEKRAYLSGFIAGAAVGQVREDAARAGRTGDSAATASGAIAQLVSGKDLWFSYTPAVYASQMDDFYWWTDHVDTPIVDVLQALNRRMKTP